ncbi:hypothetical protein DV737_g1144, partial [Chaetothyriales sp. CBS 132003]
MVMGIRLLAKQGFGSYGIDDWTAIAATVSGVAQSILIFVAVATGMGRDYNDISSSQAGLIARWEIVGILNGASELLVLVLATCIVWPLQLPPTRKFVVLCSFIPRLLVIVLIVPHIVTLSKSTHTTRLRGPSLAVPEVYLQVQMMYAIFSAAVPSLNRWLRKFDTSMGTQWQSSAYGSSRGSHGKAGTRSTDTNHHSFIMKSLNSVDKSQNRSQLRSRNSIDDPNNFRTQPTGYQANVQGRGTMEPESRSGSQASIHSQSKIIRKETRWYVDYSDE